jgi:dTDP-4-amino-4,6-dideoxygalactose transaminase
MGSDLTVSEKLCEEVISIPIHTEMDEAQLDFIIEVIFSF